MIVKGKNYTTDEEARNCFRSSGLTYADLTESTVRMLEGRIAEALLRAGTGGEGDYEPMYPMTVSDTQIGDHFVNVRVDSGFFKSREAVSIWDNGNVHIASWARSRNAEPIKKAFMEWCGAVASLKSEGMLRTDEAWCDHVDGKQVWLSYAMDEDDEYGGYEVDSILTSTREKAIKRLKALYDYHCDALMENSYSYHIRPWTVGRMVEDSGTDEDVTELIRGGEAD